MLKAVNATTVEVTFKDAVENINSLNFTIEGLTVSNAAVKQTDNKTVVLTTAVQEGGKEYTVSLNSKEIGKFKGVSAVVPSKIDITTQSVQGKTGQQAIISADVGVKQEGIPVTFNVKADTNNTLNKDQVFEAVTNADGIATFSYTQYAAGTDQVTAYPTGAPTVRSHAFVFWGVDNILTISPADKASEDKGNTLNNGEDKTYKLTYLDPKTGKPVANQRFFVTFEENINVNIDKTSKATVNGENPRQLLSNENPVVAPVTTDSKGEAVFTVSGSNTAVTPVVFIDNEDRDYVKATTYEPSKLQAKAEKVTFSALQQVYTIDVTREGGEEAATGYKNGREYKVVVKNKDGKVAANELVNIAFNEDLDRNLHTNTSALFVKDEDDNGNPIVTTRNDNQITVKTNSKGEATFTIVSTDNKDYATPIAWIDINSSNAKEGKFDEGEPYKIAPITYFAEPKLTKGTVTAYDETGKVPRTNKPEFDGRDTAVFKFTAANQSGKTMELTEDYENIAATFTVFNNGENDIVVTVDGDKTVVSSNRSFTTKTIKNAEPTITIETGDGKTTSDLSGSVKVVANGTANPVSGKNLRPINLGSDTVEAKFVSSKSVGKLHTGIVDTINTDKRTLTFVGKSAVSYKDASFYNTNGVGLTLAEFETLIKANEKKAKVTYKVIDDKVIFEIVSLTGTESSLVDMVNAATTKEALRKALETSAVFNSLTADGKNDVVDAIFLELQAGNTFTPASLAKAIDVEVRVDAKYTAGSEGKVGEKATGSFVDGDNKLEVETATGATAYNDVTIKFVKNTVESTDVKTEYKDKVLTVFLPVSIDEVTNEATLTDAATFENVVDAIEAFNKGALSVTLTGFAADDSAEVLLGKSIELKGATATVDPVDATLVLTFSDALTTIDFGDLTFKGGSSVTAIQSEATVSADKKTVTIKVKGTDKVIVGDTITGLGSYAVDGKEIVLPITIK
ncbi:hypothetical protein [Sporosarcina sp. USHLN248]|uniref:hypothetical protein n=1 Tax=Sporosarcina sp. USHLN248 TaxID=3081300 RepID=UPI00301933B6